MNVCKCGCGRGCNNNFVHGHNLIGMPMWNTGLTKETDTRLLKSSELRKGSRAWNKGLDETDPRYAAWLKSIKAASRSIEKRIKNAEGTRAAWAADVKRRELQSTRMKAANLWGNAEFVKNWHLARKRHPNKTEMHFLEVLEESFPGVWRFTGDGYGVVGTKSPDFMRADNIPQVIELFGVYYHRKETGEERTAYYKKLGYDCLIVWEDELQDIGQITERVSRLLTGIVKNNYRTVAEEPRILITCRVCGGEFLSFGRQTCNKKCRYILASSKKMKERIEITCKQCAAKLLVLPSQALHKHFCSIGCRNLSYAGKPFPNPYDSRKDPVVEQARREKLMVGRIERKCIICESAFLVRETTKPNRKLSCSLKCSYILRGRLSQDRAKRNKLLSFAVG